MTIYQLSIPSKNFLLGEYVVLDQSPGLVLTTARRFTLHARVSSKKQNFLPEGIHPESPSGKLIQEYQHLFENLEIHFNDPYQRLGGFGASGALFLMVSILINQPQKRTTTDETLLHSYRHYSSSEKNRLPSRVDLIAQRYGGICFFHRALSQLQVFNWPFSDLDYCFIHTGSKLATHEHLKNKFDFDAYLLKQTVEQGVDAPKTNDSKKFIDAINTYSELLDQFNLVAAKTKFLREQLIQHPAILAVKGCGALGADTILVLFEHNNARVIHYIKEQQLMIKNYGQSVETRLQLTMNQEDHINTEKIILVNPDDHIIGEIEKIQAHRYAMLHRAFSIILFRKKNGTIETLLQQRSIQKYHCGGLWTNTCCSHPHPNECILSSAKNRLKEEMGITAFLKEVGSFHYVAVLDKGMTENEIDHVFIGDYDGNEIPFNHNEVQAYRWVNVDTLNKDWNEHSEQYTPWFKKAFDFAYTAYVGSV